MIRPVFENTPQSPTNFTRPAPTADLRGFNVDLSQVAQAQQIPQIDLRGFSIEGAGAARFGAVVQREFSALSELRVRQLEAIAIRKEQESMLDMEAEAAEIEKAKLAEPDETKWEGIAAQRIQAFRERLFDAERNPLSPAAREAIEMRFKAWSTRTTAKLSVDSAARSIDKATESIKAQRATALRNGDYDTVRDLTQKGITAGFLPETDAPATEDAIDREMKRKQAEAKRDAEEAAINSALGAAEIDADKTAEIVNEENFGKDLDPTVRARVRSVVREQQVKAFSDLTAQVDDAIVSGQVQTPAALDAMLPDTVRPADRARFREQLEKYQTEIDRAQNTKPAVIRERFGDLLDKVDSYDRDALGGPASQQARDAYLEIRMAALLLPPEIRGEVTQKLEQKWRAAQPAMSGEVKDYVDQSITDLYNSGAFGSFAVTTPDGKTQTDWKAKAKANERRADAVIELKKWMDTNPQATRDEATAQILRVAGGTLRQDDLRAIFGAADAATQPGPDGSLFPVTTNPEPPDLGPPPPGTYDMPEQDMPNQPGPPGNILLQP